MTNTLGTGLETEVNELHHREVHERIYKPSNDLVDICRGLRSAFYIEFTLHL